MQTLEMNGYRYSRYLEKRKNKKNVKITNPESVILAFTKTLIEARTKYGPLQLKVQKVCVSCFNSPVFSP